MWQQIIKGIRQLLSRAPSIDAVQLPQTSDQDWWAQWEAERLHRRQQREERRRQRKASDRTYFGEETWGVSEGQRKAATDPAKLARFGLPALASEAELATWLGISLGQLRRFTHDKPADTTSHYVRRTITKKGGGERVILAPKRQLKALQRKVLHELLAHVPAADVAHGFLHGRSIVTNAAPHVGQQVVLNLDLKDFFSTVTYPRVRGMFIALGYSFSVGSTLALLCTEHDREVYERDGTGYYVSVGPRCLPQGAPTSPALANIAAWRLDRRLNGLAQARGWRYTRYADDLTFSGPSRNEARRLLAAARHIIAAEDFVVHPEKIHIAPHSARQTVTGLVVNEHLGTPRELRRRLRATLHNAAQTGLEAQNHNGHPHFRAYLRGLIGHVANANPTQGAQLDQALRALE